MPNAPETWDEASESRRAIAWTRVAGELSGLTPEQVAAIPRLIAWFMDTGRLSADAVEREEWELATIFLPGGS